MPLLTRALRDYAFSEYLLLQDCTVRPSYDVLGRTSRSKHATHRIVLQVPNRVTSSHGRISPLVCINKNNIIERNLSRDHIVMYK